VLTQVFDWRSIFFAQAPLAVVAAVAVLGARATSDVTADEAPSDAHSSTLAPLYANTALTVLSAALIGALFLVVVELINAWLLEPIVAAAIVSAIPIATAVAERLVRGRSPMVLAGAGAVLLALGLAGVALASYRELGVVISSLALCGAGLGLAYPGLTTAALRGAGPLAARAARTVAARDAGILIGLLLLSPVFVSDLGAAPAKATSPVIGAIGGSGLPLSLEFALAGALQKAVARAPATSPPNIAPAFARVAAEAGPSDRARLAALEPRVEMIVQDAVTSSFTRALEYAAIMALLVLPVLAVGAWNLR
jgi:hypothetical protein